MPGVSHRLGAALTRARLLAPVSFACLALFAPATACAFTAVHGDGHLVTRTRPISGFTHVRYRLPIDLDVVESGPASVIVEVDRNLQPLVQTRVEDGTLVIDAKRPGIDPTRGAKVIVRLPRLDGLSMHGSADVDVDAGAPTRDLAFDLHGSGGLNFHGHVRVLDLSGHGSGDVVLVGSAERLRTSMAGSGDLTASDFHAQNASVDLRGSGDASLAIDGGEAHFSIRGSGDIDWRGTAKVTGTEVRGSGSITHV